MLFTVIMSVSGTCPVSAKYLPPDIHMRPASWHISSWDDPACTWQDLQASLFGMHSNSTTIRCYMLHGVQDFDYEGCGEDCLCSYAFELWTGRVL